MMDSITFRSLVSLTVSKRLDMRFMDVVTTYLYRFIDIDIYMKILEGFKLSEAIQNLETCTQLNYKDLYTD